MCVDRLANYETFSFFLVHHYSVRLVCLHRQICLNFKVPQDLCVLRLKNKLRCMIILCFASLEDYSVYHLSNFVVSTVPVMLLHELHHSATTCATVSFLTLHILHAGDSSCLSTLNLMLFATSQCPVLSSS